MISVIQGDLVVLDDYIDMTKYRVNTHVGNAVENGGPRGNGILYPCTVSTVSNCIIFL